MPTQIPLDEASIAEVLRQALHRLADAFDRVAIPAHGHYVTHPTTVDDGSTYVHRR